MGDRRSSSIRVLFLAANPVQDALLRLNEEYEQIKEAVDGAEFGDCFDLEPVLSTDVDRLFSTLLKHQPNIVHFSGHGSTTEEIFLHVTPEIERSLRHIGPTTLTTDNGHRLGKDVLVQILSSIRDVRIVVLNACYSAKQAEKIADIVDWVIGMKSAVGDDAARVFSVQFYQALAFDRSVPQAFEIAKAKLAAFHLPDQDLPRLYKGEGADDTQAFLSAFSNKSPVSASRKGQVPTSSIGPSRFVVLRVGGSPNVIECHFRQAVELGRSEACDVTFRDAENDVGNSHARVSFHENRETYEIIDLGSANGTFVNNDRLAPREPRELQVGDALRFGESLRLLFRPQLNEDKERESCAALVRLDKEGREWDCIVIAPRDRVLIGNGEGCVARIPPPVLDEGRCIGAIERTQSGLRFQENRDDDGSDYVPLDNGSEITSRQLTIRVRIPKKLIDVDQTPTFHDGSQTLEPGRVPEKEFKKPDPYEMPTWINRLNILLGVFSLIVLPLALYVFRPDPLDKVVETWFASCHDLLTQPGGLGWRPSTTGVAPSWPPEGQIQPCVVVRTEDLEAYKRHGERLLEAVPAKNLLKTDYPDPSKFSESYLKDFRSKSLFLVKFESHATSTSLIVNYFDSYKEGSAMQFEFVERLGPLRRHSPRIASAVFAGVLLLGTRAFCITSFRRRRMSEYENWQSRRTKETYELKRLLDEGRQLARTGQDARALTLINQVLERRSSYDEAAELKRLIKIRVGAQRGTLVSGDGSRETSDAIAADIPNLFLRIVQTPYAYRAPRGFDRITLGRQRGRKQTGEATSTHGDDREGNDLVVRVPGSDRLSLRISRRHMEIQRIDKEFFVQDLSGGQSTLNGRSLTKGRPYPIVSGDRLAIAGVIVLQVQIQAALDEGAIVDKVIQVQQLKGSSFEATIGDMVTELPHD